MVAATELPQKPGLISRHGSHEDRPRKRRFRLFAALAAPFRDVDDRALHKTRKNVEVRNNSKGNMFTPRAAASLPLPVRQFPRGDD